MTTDDELWLPPTEPGMTRLDGETWLTRRGTELVPIQLDDMRPAHRVAVLQWLRDHAALMHRHESDWLARRYARGALSLERFQSRHREHNGTPPHIWIEDTALVRRLHTLIRRDRQRGATP